MNTQINFYNCHTHRKPQFPQEVGIRNAFLYPVSDFHPEYFLSSGLHPWFIEQIDEKQLSSILSKNILNRQVLAIGEIGLDKFAGNFERQKRLFSIQLEIASEKKMPAILHQVKSAGEMTSLVNNFHEPLILHGFTSHISVWEQLNKNQNTYVSFGASALNPSEKLIETIRKIPLENMLLETDNAPVKIQEIYQSISRIKELEPDYLAEKVESNFNLVFKPVWNDEL